MELTIIIPYYNGEAFITPLLDSIPARYPVVVVDDHSDVPLHLDHQKHKNVKVIRPEKKGYFAGAVNEGLKATRGDVLVLNQDTLFTSDAPFAKLANLPKEVAIAGDGVFGHPAWPNGYVQGTFMFLRREAVNQVGFFNVTDYPLWGATAEWQLRACRANWVAQPWHTIAGWRHLREDGERFGPSIQTLLGRQPDDTDLLVRTPPAISVVVPCYNQGRFLPDCVASLIGGHADLFGGELPGQTFQSFEILLVDDASTDATQEIGQALADPWRGIRYIRREENGGTPAANNTGIEAAYGKYITILCADDLRAPRALEKLYRAAQAHPHAIIYDDVFLKFTSGRETVWEMKEYDFEALLERNTIHAGILFPKQAWREVGGYPTGMKYGREDWAVNVAFGIHGWCGMHVKYPGYIYRRHDANRTLTNSSEEWREEFVAQMKALYPHIYQGERPMACCGRKDPMIQEFAQPNDPLAGSTGMTLVEYQGENVGNEAYYGPVTGARYTFSSLRRVKNVDRRDLHTESGSGLLDLYIDGKPLFIRHAPSAPPQAPAALDGSETVALEKESGPTTDPTPRKGAARGKKANLTSPDAPERA